METGRLHYAPDRKAWRSWLRRHHNTETEVWLVYYRKSSGKPRIPYNDAVEEALCFGWIDSTAKRIDDERFAQRFSPRRKGSRLSQLNRERLVSLISEGLMTPAGLAAVSHAFDPKAPHKNPKIRKDVLSALRKDPAAWRHFRNLPERYVRVRIAYIESQRLHGRPAFRRSLDNFIKKTSENKRFGSMRG